MEKKVMNTRLAVAAVVLLFGLLLLAGQEAAAAEATTPTAPSDDKAGGGYGKASKADCEVPGTCDVKVTAANDKPAPRPGSEANPYTRGCSRITGCRD